MRSRGLLTILFGLLQACVGSTRSDEMFSALAAGARFTCGLTPHGQVFCWGVNTSGELGTDTARDRCLDTRRLAHSPPPEPVSCSARPLRVATGLRFRELTAGWSHACAITHDGEAYCWGSNEHGQLGIGSATPANHPTPIPVAGGLRFRTIAAGAWHTCAIAYDGPTYCWGHNGDGRAGTPLDSACVKYDQRIPCKLAPTAVSTELRFTNIALGAFTSCGVTGHTGYCWGSHTVLGTDAAVDDGCRAHYACSTRPQPVAGNITFRSIDIGDFTACGVSTTRRAYCWGHNQSATLGIGVWNDSTYRVPQALAEGLRVDTVAVSGMFACALTPRGVLYCWGSDVRGAMGEASAAHNSSPARAFRTPQFRLISTGLTHACGISVAGETYCWGENTFGQLGAGRIGPDSVATLMRVVQP
jgi:alpha-tubulin suppressor-like RCC1 family protein